MAGRVVKSILWLVGLSGLGAGLFIGLTPNEEEIKRDLPGLETVRETQTKKQQFVNVLEAAATSNKPLYRLNKEALDKELK